MITTELELKAFEDGTLHHCGEQVCWHDCDKHETDCYIAYCHTCYQQWKDCDTVCGHEWDLCPRHEGAFDCTPFCNLCEGNQAYCPTCNNEPKG